MELQYETLTERSKVNHDLWFNMSSEKHDFGFNSFLKINFSKECYIPNPKAMNLLVLEKIFKGVLPYMGMSAIFVM